MHGPSHHRIQSDTDGSAARRVLIIDDSVVARSVIERLVQSIPGFVIAGAVPDAMRALRFLTENRVDVILLDIELPGMDGLTALPRLIEAGAGARVLIVSSAASDGAASSIQALALGAADTLVKPGIGSFAGRFADNLTEKLSRLVDRPQLDAVQVPVPALPLPPQAIGSFDVIAIGASTGGIHALSGMLREIPPGMTAPILITQHLPESFMPYFAAQLAVLAGRPCDVASDHLRVRPGRIVIAPGTAHMVCVKTADGVAIRLSDSPAPSGCLPSVDPMFHSIGQVYGDRALAVVLSGMGRDGVRGAAELVARGGRLIAQDQATSVVWGMPGAAVQANLAQFVLPPQEIGRLIARRRPA
ncbi:chemotaxis-specific protein-glutamate methyltransferase CheB [Sphingomonas sp. CJ99]